MVATPSPVAQMVKLGGVEATIITPWVGDSKDYDPAAPGSFKPSEPQRFGVTGVQTDGVAAGLDVRFTGTFLIEADCLPPNIQTGKSHLRLGGQSFVIDSYKARVYRGEIDGYDLYLTR